MTIDGTSRSLHLLMIDVMKGIRNRKMLNWKPAELEPLLTYKHLNGSQSPFFTELLLVPQRSSRGRFYCGLYSGYKHPQKADWLEWIEWLFNRINGPYLLADMANHHEIQELGIWLMLPYPPYGDYMYESGSGSKSFNLRLLRLTALQNAIDMIVARWELEFSATPLKLRGFAWGREGMPQHDFEIVSLCNEWIESHGLERLWLPNYRAAHVIEWKELGFSQTAIFSNYTGNSNLGKDWINQTYQFAALNRMGIQLVNGKGFIYDRTHFIEYLARLDAYKLQGGTGPFVYSFPNGSPYELYRSNRMVYDKMYEAVSGEGSD